MEWILPRETPDRDSKYMGLAWMQAGFSKDPSTQVGAIVVTPDNYPLGQGYNGPPRLIKDDSFSWSRPPADNPDALSKYDVVDHAEENAIEHCRGDLLTGATIYVTALPCPHCMRLIVRKEISRVVYFDYQPSATSSLNNAAWRDRSFEIARLGGVTVELFAGKLEWLQDWVSTLEVKGVIP